MGIEKEVKNRRNCLWSVENVAEYAEEVKQNGKCCENR